MHYIPKHTVYTIYIAVSRTLDELFMREYVYSVRLHYVLTFDVCHVTYSIEYTVMFLNMEEFFN